MFNFIFSNIFDQTTKVSQQIWLFQRYRQVMEYQGTPFIPPPFTFIYYFFMFFKYLRYRNRYCLLNKKFCFKYSCCKCLKSKKSNEFCYKDKLSKCKIERHTNNSNLSLFDFSLSEYINFIY